MTPAEINGIVFATFHEAVVIGIVLHELRGGFLLKATATLSDGQLLNRVRGVSLYGVHAYESLPATRHQQLCGVRVGIRRRIVDENLRINQNNNKFECHDSNFI